METKPSASSDVVIVGGMGHVGLPLGLVFAEHGYQTCLYDIDEEKMALVANGKMPFIEYDAEPILSRVLKKTLHLSTKMESIAGAKHVVICLGTPVDGYLNPGTRIFLKTLETFKPFLNTKQ